MSRTKVPSEYSNISFVANKALYGSIIEFDNLAEGKIAKLSLGFWLYSNESFWRSIDPKVDPAEPLIELKIRKPERLLH